MTKVIDSIVEFKVKDNVKPSLFGNLQEQIKYHAQRAKAERGDAARGYHEDKVKELSAKLKAEKNG